MVRPHNNVHRRAANRLRDQPVMFPAFEGREDALSWVGDGVATVSRHQSIIVEADVSFSPTGYHRESFANERGWL